MGLLICYEGCAPDWDALSAIATTAAVLVALWLPWRDRKGDELRKLEAEVRAAEIISPTLSGAIEILPQLIDHAKETRGIVIDGPAIGVGWGLNVCHDIVQKEAFMHQLPTELLGRAELVVSLARMWIFDDELRRQTLADPRWAAVAERFTAEPFVLKGALLLREAVFVRDHSRALADAFEASQLPWWRRCIPKPIRGRSSFAYSEC